MCSEHKSQKVQKPFKQDQSLSLQQCFQAFGNEEQLEQDNAWYCGTCKEHVMAFKKLQLYKLPQILLIALKRFKARGFYREKNSTLVDFPLEGLDLSEFISIQNENNSIYDCFAVSNHYGGLGGGHYTAFALNQSIETWVEYDDSNVRKVRGINEIISSAAYVLFYRRRSKN